MKKLSVNHEFHAGSAALCSVTDLIINPFSCSVVCRTRVRLFYNNFALQREFPVRVNITALSSLRRILLYYLPLVSSSGLMGVNRHCSFLMTLSRGQRSEDMRAWLDSH